MTHTEIIKKAIECNTHEKFCDFGTTLIYGQISDDAPDLCDGFTASFSSIDDTEGLISLHGKFGNIRINFNDGIIEIFKRTWNSDRTEFKDEKMQELKYENS